MSAAPWRNLREEGEGDRKWEIGKRGRDKWENGRVGVDRIKYILA